MDIPKNKGKKNQNEGIHQRKNHNNIEVRKSTGKILHENGKNLEIKIKCLVRDIRPI